MVESTYNAGYPGSIPGLGRSPEEGNGNPLQYSCLENPMDREPGEPQSLGLQRVGHDWVTNTSLYHSTFQAKCFIILHSDSETNSYI